MNKSFGYFVALILPTIFIFSIFFPLKISAQDGLPASTYFYYGWQITLDEMGQIATQRFQENDMYIDCVYVPDDDLTIADNYQVFECFNTLEEASRFSDQLHSDNALDIISLEQPSGVAVQTSCSYWAVYSQSYHSSWAGDICAGQSVYVGIGIWSIWDGASNQIRLSDNPNYVGLRWTFGSTQYTLSAGPGGTRQAYHCSTPTC